MSGAPATIVEVLARRAAAQADDLAFRFLGDGDGDEATVTYASLHRRARAIAAALTDAGATDRRAVLLYPAGLEFVAALLGCFLARVVAVPTYPPDPARLDRTLPRLRGLVAGARAELLLTCAPVAALARGPVATLAPELAALRWIVTDACADDAGWRAPAVVPADVALLQYTSGSTGDPRGVVLTHANLMHNEGLMHAAVEHDRSMHFLGWLPLTHDMGLFNQVLHPLHVGLPSTVMAPEQFLRRPIRWLAAISRHRATWSGAPNFAYEQCVRKTTAAERAGLDLSCWRVAFTGAEPIRADTIARFLELFAPHGLRPEAVTTCYGLAEATVLVTARRGPAVVRAVADGTGATRALVGSGRPLGDQRVIVVDPEARVRSPDGAAGEVWLAGGSVGAGYFERPEETAATFGARLADGDGPFLRTGDLAVMLDGDLFVTGRLRDLVILRGRNHHPHDLERTAEAAHTAVRPGCGAAFAVEVDGEERLVLALEVDERVVADPAALAAAARAVRRAITDEHGVVPHDVALVRPRAVAKTTSGKVMRRACRAAYLAGTLARVDADGADRAADAARSDGEAANGTAAAPADDEAAASAARADAVIAWLRGYARARINSRTIDERRCIPPPIILDFGNHGLFGMLVPPAYGGLGLRCVDMYRVVEQLAAIDLTLAVFVGLNNTLGVRTLLRHGGPRRRDELLPALAAGRVLAAFAYTEAAAGSHPWAIAATATDLGDGRHRLRGTKIWSGTSAWAGAIHVFARTIGPDGRPGGISAFVVPADAPGLRIGPEALTMGVRGMVQNTVHLDDVIVGPDDVLGRVDHGMDVAQDAMRHARLGLAALALGGVKRCLQLMLRYAGRRRVGTGRLLDNPVTLARLGELAAGADALAAFVAQTAALVDRGVEPAEEAFCAAKIAGPELLGRAADQLVQLLGGRGYIESNLAPQILRDARLLRIFEGPSETMQMHLGARVVHAPAAFDAWLAGDLGAPALAGRLRAAVVEARARGPGAAFDETGRLRWLQYLAGDAATAAALAAASARAGSAPAVAWAEAWFDRACERLRIGAPEEATARDPTAIAAHIDELAASIGDVEQTLPGADDPLDPLLRIAADEPARTRSATASDATSASAWSQQASPGASRTPQRGAATQPAATGTSPRSGLASPGAPPTAISTRPDASPDGAAIAAWLVAWIAAQTGRPADAIDLDDPFADHGVDSVTGVQLVADLEQWLARPVSPSLVWEHPTIARAAARLAGTSAPTPAAADDELLARVEAMSDEEVEALLAASRRGPA